MARIVPVGCLPDDGLDDRVCIQAALDAACLTAGGTVFLDTGTWNVTRPAAVPGSRDNASLWMECSNLALVGDGPRTVVMMTGDGYGADWAAVRVSADLSGNPTERVRISDMVIASDDAYNLQEQTHLVMFGSTVNAPGRITDVGVHDVILRHPVRPEVAGDCLRFVGEAATPITVVDVGSVIFEACDRSGIAVQRGVQDVDFHDIVMIDIGKTGVDMEPTGTGPIARFSMRNMHIEGGMTVAGQASEWTRDISVSSTHISGRLGLIYARDVSFTGVHVKDLATGSEGSLFIRASEDVKFVGGSVVRSSGSAAGAAVKMSGSNGTYPTNIKIVGSDITSEIAGPVVDIESLKDSNISNNAITGADAANPAVLIRATGRDIGGLEIVDNRIRGVFQFGVKLSGGPQNVTGAVISGNYSTGVTSAGLRCENPLKFTKPVIHAGYFYDTAATATSGCTGVSIVTQAP